MLDFIKKKVFFIAIAIAAILLIFFISFEFGLIGNSDTQLGVNIANILSKSFFSWQGVNSGHEYFFPSLAPTIFQGLFNLLGISFSSTGVIILVFVLLFFTTFKLVCYLLDIKKDRAGTLVIFIVSLFAINNDYIAPLVIICSTMIWTFFFFILSVYLFFRYHFEKKLVYLILFQLVVMIIFMDFHMAILSLIFVFSYLFVELFYELFSYKKINSGLIYEFLKITALFLLFNSYWIITNINSFFNGKKSIFASYNNTNSTDGYLDAIFKLTSPSFNLVLSQIKSFSSNLFYSIDAAGSFIMLGLFIAGIFFIRKEKNERIKRTLSILFVQFIIFISLSLGQKNPLGIFDFFWKYVPMFKIFRNFEKFNRLIIPMFIIIISYSLIKISSAKKNYGKVLTGIILVVMLVKFTPFFYDFKKYLPYKIPDYYYDFYEFTKTDKFQGKVQVLPTITNYIGLTWSNQDYDMQEPITYFTDKPISVNGASYSPNSEELANEKISQLFFEGNQKNLFGLTSFRNIKYFVIRNDLQKKSLDKNKVDVEKFSAAANQNGGLRLIGKFGQLDLYSANNAHFLPHFYVPEEIIASRRTTEELDRIFSGDGYSTSTAVFFSKQNDNREASLDTFNYKKNSNLSVEFKEVNPTKYRIRIHRASGTFPLVFSESFHEGWKAYLNQNANLKNKNDNVKLKMEDYKILDNNEEDQATKEELTSFIKNSQITTLGDGKEREVIHKKWENMIERKNYVEKYTIGFISRDIYGTLQNDNLPDGNIFETWLTRPIDDNANHLMANGYANSWVIDPYKSCKNNKLCIKNPDGTYDFEMIVEFWPQRLFYVGLFVSAMTLLASISYLLYNYKKDPRQG